MSSTSQPPADAIFVGAYRIVAELARGGMATVYLGVRGSPPGMVAIKQIHPHLAHDPEFVAMMMDEARIASQIHHPNVVEIREFQAGSGGAGHFVVMEYAHGETVAQLLKTAIARNVRIGYEVAASVAAEMAGALHAAHELRGPAGEHLELVHRDVSPQNVIVTFDGRVKLTDFGIAKALGRLQRTQPGEIKGKLAYMSPEQLYGRPLDRRSDVYSLGIVLYELSLNRRLFRGNTDAETIRNVMSGVVPSPRSLDPSYPPVLEEIVLALLAQNPAERFQTAGAAERALKGWLDSIGFRDAVRLRSELVQSLEPDRHKLKNELVRNALKEAGQAALPMGDATLRDPNPASVWGTFQDDLPTNVSMPSAAPQAVQPFQPAAQPYIPPPAPTPHLHAHALADAPTLQAPPPRPRPATGPTPAPDPAPWGQPVARVATPVGPSIPDATVQGPPPQPVPSAPPLRVEAPIVPVAQPPRSPEFLPPNATTHSMPSAQRPGRRWGVVVLAMVLAGMLAGGLMFVALKLFVR